MQLWHSNLNFQKKQIDIGNFTFFISTTDNEQKHPEANYHWNMKHSRVLHFFSEMAMYKNTPIRLWSLACIFFSRTFEPKPKKNPSPTFLQGFGSANMCTGQISRICIKHFHRKTTCRFWKFSRSCSNAQYCCDDFGFVLSCCWQSSSGILWAITTPSKTLLATNR